MKRVKDTPAANRQAGPMVPMKGFANLTARQLALAAATSLTTARRWRRLGKAPRAIMKALELTTWGELGEISARWNGWRMEPHTGALWTPDGWQVDPGEIMALPFQYQRISSLETKLRALRAELAQTNGRTHEDQRLDIVGNTASLHVLLPRGNQR